MSVSTTQHATAPDSPATALSVIEHNASSGNPDYSIIALHGLGADARDMTFMHTTLRQATQTAQCRFIYPQAPTMPVTINQGALMPAWFDITTLNWDASWEKTDWQRACQPIIALIEHEIKRGVASQRIVLAGFSQGGALALITGLTYPKPLAGMIGLSTFLPVDDVMHQSFSEANRATPICLAHGASDAVVDFEVGQRTAVSLSASHAKVHRLDYPDLAHSVSPQELADIDRWLVTQVLSARR